MRHPGADYRQADVASWASLDAVFAAVRPDVVFHLAAQRDPGLAERASHLTVSTNVLGTRNVVQACERHGVAELSYASSGKALRPYSREVYTAAKRAGEMHVSRTWVSLTHSDHSAVAVVILEGETGTAPPGRNA